MARPGGPRRFDNRALRGPVDSRHRRRRASAYHVGPRLRARSIILTVIGFLISGLIGAGTYFWPAVTTALAGTGQHIAQAANGPSPTGGAAAASAAADTPAAAGQPFTVLLLGSDNDSKFQGDQVLTQSMILVRVDPQANSVTMFSIPRDLYVPMYSGQTDKIDKAWLFGGATDAVRTVEQDFHVHIDHYIWIGLQGLVNLINLVGGVDVATTHPVFDDFYPADQTSQNPYDLDRVAVLGGPQHLDGLHAMEYVRSRHDDLLSDIGRSQRQQQVLVALRAKAGRLGVADLPRLAGALSGQFKTDIDITDLGYLSSLLGIARHVDPGNVGHVVLLPPYWQAQTIDNQDVLMPNWDLILPLVHKTFPDQ